MKDYEYPALVPEELPRRLMELFSSTHDIILDLSMVRVFAHWLPG